MTTHALLWRVYECRLADKGVASFRLIAECASKREAVRYLPVQGPIPVIRQGRDYIVRLPR